MDTDFFDSDLNDKINIILFMFNRPCILVFDSLAGASRSRVVATLRDYLTCEYKAKIKVPADHVFDRFNIVGHSVKVPQQTNFTDCGLYVLQYVEQFFKVRFNFIVYNEVKITSTLINFQLLGSNQELSYTHQRIDQMV